MSPWRWPTFTNAIVVPREAVNIGPDGQFVYVVDAGHAVEQAPVKVLFDDGADMAIQGDVKPGDKVITDGAAARAARRQGQHREPAAGAGGAADEGARQGPRRRQAVRNDNDG